MRKLCGILAAALLATTVYVPALATEAEDVVSLMGATVGDTKSETDLVAEVGEVLASVDTDADFEAMSSSKNVSANATDFGKKEVSNGVLTLTSGVHLSDSPDGYTTLNAEKADEAFAAQENGAIHVRFTPLQHTTIIEMYDGSHRFRIQNGANMTLAVWQGSGAKDFTNTGMAYGEAFDVFLIQRSGGYEVWGKKAADTDFTYFGDTTGFRAGSGNKLKITAQSTTVGEAGKVSVDFVKMYAAKDDSSNTPGATGTTEADLLKGMEAVTVLDSKSDFLPLTQNPVTSWENAPAFGDLKKPTITADGSLTVSDAGILNVKGGSGEANAGMEENDKKFQVGSAAHFRYTYKGGTCIIGIFNGSTRLRFQNNANGSISTYGASDVGSLGGDPAVVGETYDIIALYQADGIEFWRMTNDSGTYEKIGKSNGVRAAGTNGTGIIRFYTSSGEMDVDFMKIYVPGSGSDAPVAEGSVKSEKDIVGNLATIASEEFNTDLGEGKVVKSDYYESDLTASKIVKGETENDPSYLSLKDCAAYTRNGFTVAPGGIAHFRFRTNSGSAVVDLHSKGARLRFAQLDGTKLHWVDTTGFPYMSYPGGLKMGQWYEYLLVRTETNFQLWHKAPGDTDFTCIKISNGLKESSSDSLRFTADGIPAAAPTTMGEVDIDFIRIYGAEGEEDTSDKEASFNKIVGDKKILHSVEFNKAADLEGGKVNGGTHNVANGVLSLSGNADYQLKDTFTFDPGDVAYFSGTYKGGQNIWELNSNSLRMRITMDGSILTIAKKGAEVNVSDWDRISWTISSGSKVEFLVVNQETGYEIWGRQNEEEKFTKIHTTPSKSSWASAELRLLGVGSMDVNFVRVYSVNGNGEAPDDSETGGDTSTITSAVEKNVLWLKEDFNDASNHKVSKLEDASIGGGTANILPNSTHRNDGVDNFARIEFDLSNYDLGNHWNVFFKMNLRGVKMAANFGTGGTRAMWVVDPNNIVLQGTGRSVATETNVWYEYLFAFDSGTSYSLYRRKVGESGWIAIATNVAMGSWGGNKLEFNTNMMGSDVSIDDLMIYSGSVIDFKAGAPEGSVIKTTGSYFGGKPGEKKEVIIAAISYDKEKGYTKEVQTIKKSINGATETSLDTTMTLSGLDTTKDDVAVLLWDSVANGAPLAEAQGYLASNEATGKPAADQEVGVTAAARYNEVRLTGYTGEQCSVTASLSKDGDIKAMIETKSNENGMLDTAVAVDPALASGEYKLNVRFGANILKEETVTLWCNDVFTESTVNSVETFVEFINKYGTEEEKEAIKDETFAKEAYARYLALAGESTIDNVYAFDAASGKAIRDEIDETALLAALNKASAENRWSDISDLLMVTYRTFLGISEDAIDGIKSEKDLYLRMAGGAVYTKAEDVTKAFDAAIVAQKEAEKTPGQSTLGGISNNRYQGAVSVVGTVPTGKNDPIINKDTESDVAAFTDLDSVEWAKDSIANMQKLGILSGDGNGLFNPDRAVTREEFLKLVMNATGLEAAGNVGMTFADVDANAWYYSYVAGAYELGIVKGVSETSFGIGQQITRADMAVMLRRAIERAGMVLEPTETAFVFDDFAKIPEYATESVDLLCEAGLMRGVGGNTFMPLASATRAEAAVAIDRVYNYLNQEA